jgi:hypothetical protein
MRKDEHRDETTPTTADLTAAADAATRRSVEQGELMDREVPLRREDMPSDDADELDVRLLPDEIVDDLRPRWADIQASFVDEPRRAVEQADALVADAIGRLAEAFAEARSNLEHDWDRGEEVSTEDLRLALRRYRTFFDRLLQI